jgi:hypothetical protein
LSFKTGNSTNGSSGAIILKSGTAALGAAGSISIVVGDSAGTDFNGGDMLMKAGSATGSGTSGSVTIEAPDKFEVTTGNAQTALKVDATGSYFKTAGTLTLTGNSDSAGSSSTITLGTNISITGSGNVEFTTTHSTATANAFVFGAEGSSGSYAGTVKVTGKTFFQDGIGFGRFDGGTSGTYSSSPLLYYMNQGVVDFYDSYCTSPFTANTITTALIPNASNAAPAGCYIKFSGGGEYMQARHTIAMPSGGWKAGTYFKSFVTPPERLGTIKYDSSSSSAIGYYSCAPYSPTDSSNLGVSTDVCPIIWMSWVGGVGSAVKIYVRLMNAKDTTLSIPLANGFCSLGASSAHDTETECNNSGGVWTPEWDWQYLVFGHRCHGATATLGCYSNYA